MSNFHVEIFSFSGITQQNFSYLMWKMAVYRLQCYIRGYHIYMQQKEAAIREELQWESEKIEKACKLWQLSIRMLLLDTCRKKNRKSALSSFSKKARFIGRWLKDGAILLIITIINFLRFQYCYYLLLNTFML